VLLGVVGAVALGSEVTSDDRRGSSQFHVLSEADASAE
jgi:hypothetical protein